ncbi:hypothetical protein [Pulveribacter sp.]|uniref:hypothetical protein n=1 Tax=Pulveribacter sp. TaxID=2678893 RepID=UPI00289799C3|nr:hypothetical protein [Pulveribacter sp.]
MVLRSAISAACFGALCYAPAMAQDIRDQWDIKISKAELVFPNAQPQDVANGIKDALSQFAIPADLSYRAMPSSLPARPGSPQLKRVSDVIPSPEYVCEGSYAEIGKRPPPVKNAFVFISEGHQVCLYSFQKGVKAYVIYYSIKKTESLTSGLFNGITRAIRGSDEDRATGQLKENIDSIRAKLPNVLIERLEVPGRPVETPDQAAVAALIPAVEAITTASPTMRHPAQVASIASTSAPMQVKLEARKNLNGMGMLYHSQQQFIEAIRRKDDVAVQLFVEGAGVNLEAVDGEGRTPLEIAKSHSSPEIIALLQPKSQATKPAPASPADLTSTLPPVDFTKIPPDVLAEVDAEIAKANLSPEEQQAARAKWARQYLKVKMLADALNR